jgi:hypothetical protein
MKHNFNVKIVEVQIELNTHMRHTWKQTQCNTILACNFQSQEQTCIFESQFRWNGSVGKDYMRSVLPLIMNVHYDTVIVFPNVIHRPVFIQKA